MRRVRFTFLALVAVATVAAGALTRAVESEPGPIAGATVAASGLVLVGAAALLLRIFWVLNGRRAGERRG